MPVLRQNMSFLSNETYFPSINLKSKTSFNILTFIYIPFGL